MSDESTEYGEKQRICPSCRCTISVLATKCRFCGEEVGKPKDELRELSAQDLGGETILHRPPSASIMEALESYRAEEEEHIRESKIIRVGTEKSKKTSGSFDKLDEASRQLASSISTPSSQVAARRGREASPKNRALKIAGGVAVLVVCLFGGIKATGLLIDYIAQRNVEPEPEYNNQALYLLSRGEPAIVALEEAVNARNIVDNDDNRKIAEEVLGAVVKEFYALLDANPWKMEMLTEANVLATKAVKLYPNTMTRSLKKEAEKENRLYRMVLTEIDLAAGTAVFTLNETGQPKITVEKRSMIAERFLVRTIGVNKVRLEDRGREVSQGRYREVSYRVNGLPQ